MAIEIENMIPGKSPLEHGVNSEARITALSQAKSNQKFDESRLPQDLVKAEP